MGLQRRHASEKDYSKNSPTERKEENCYSITLYVHAYRRTRAKGISSLHLNINDEQWLNIDYKQFSMLNVIQVNIKSITLMLSIRKKVIAL